MIPPADVFQGMEKDSSLDPRREDVGVRDGPHDELRTQPVGPWSNLGRPREDSKAALRANFTLRPTKCVLGPKIIDFLGHWLGEGAIDLHDENIEKVQATPRPKTKNMQQFRHTFI
ncbi:Zinc finger protein [Plakobranchus ocellatus]|uniref:Zinc finger protein n=1 Tax=Plakobranchus ocellatus TaxID=259542 RepID=A0AAV4DBU8_9GAST|nr:Zinc finger protein [Plakobranchus ocellatus]